MEALGWIRVIQTQKLLKQDTPPPTYKSLQETAFYLVFQDLNTKCDISNKLTKLLSLNNSFQKIVFIKKYTYAMFLAY